jgi:hypothetical protein
MNTADTSSEAGCRNEDRIGKQNRTEVQTHNKMIDRDGTIKARRTLFCLRPPFLFFFIRKMRKNLDKLFNCSTLTRNNKNILTSLIMREVCSIPIKEETLALECM